MTSPFVALNHPFLGITLIFLTPRCYNKPVISLAGCPTAVRATRRHGNLSVPHSMLDMLVCLKDPGKGSVESGGG